jgi:membrane-associated phospholipid phosphatase
MLSLDFIKFIPMMFYNTPSTSENLPTIIFFTILILFDVFWNTNLFRSLKELMYLDTRYCYTLKQSGFAYLIGIFIGVIWANIIYSSKTPELQYFPEYKNNEMCKKASPTKYKCTVYKNGEMVKNLN